MFGKWQSALPSRFIDELPPDHVTILTPPGLYGGNYGAASPTFGRGGLGGALSGGGSSLEEAARSTNVYNSPGWKRMKTKGGGAAKRGLQSPRDVKKLAVDAVALPAFDIGQRVFHQKFGYGEVLAAEGEKLTVAFEKAGEKKVVARYLEDAARI